MKIRIFVFLLTFSLWHVYSHCHGSDDFPALVKQAMESERGEVRFTPIRIQFDVFEIRDGKAAKVSDPCDVMFPSGNYLGMFIKEQWFNGIWLDGQHCALRADAGSDIADFFSFSQCPFIPSVRDIGLMKIASQDDFVRCLGIPRYQDEEFSYIGFFNIRNDTVKFCWFFLEHSTKRLFAGVSTNSKPKNIKGQAFSQEPASGEGSLSGKGKPFNNSDSAPRQPPETMNPHANQ